MFTVALIGLDGAGKTTVCRRIEQTCAYPIKYLYMGVNADSSNHMLPTTRLLAAIRRKRRLPKAWQGPPIPGQSKPRPKGIVRRLASGGRSVLRLMNRLVEELYRLAITWFYLWRGKIVLCDRHFYFDYYAYDIAPGQPDRPFDRRIHGFFLQYIYPKPDLVIFLDAPADVLYSRKGEGTVEDLERRRKEYLRMGSLIAHFSIVDAVQPVEQVVREVKKLMNSFARSDGKIRGKVQHAHDEV